MKGVEWLVEAFGCSTAVLTDTVRLRRFFNEIVGEMKLTPVAEPVWHQFPVTGGVTGIWLLRESHLTIHTFPEFQSSCINLFCCSWHGVPDWERHLASHLCASKFLVREFSRDYSPAMAPQRQREGVFQT